MLVDGLFATVAAVRLRASVRVGGTSCSRHREHRTPSSLSSGRLTVVAFILLIAAWSIVSGCLMLSAASGSTSVMPLWLAFGGILSLVYGVLLILAPLLGALVLPVDRRLFTRIRVALIILAFRLRLRRNEYPDAPAAAARDAGGKPQPSEPRSTAAFGRYDDATRH